MIYLKEIPTNRIEDALVLTPMQIDKIKDAISKSYNQHWHKDGPNVDQMYAVVAPCLRTPEEAFYAATVILTDVFGTMMEMGVKFKK